MVGPGALKPSVGDGIESRRPLVCSYCSVSYNFVFFFLSHFFVFFLFVFTPLVVCMSIIIIIMKSTKVQNPRRILHILRSMPMREHRACAGLGQKLYACALFIIDGLGHVTWSSKMPVSRSGTAPF